MPFRWTDDYIRKSKYCKKTTHHHRYGTKLAFGRKQKNEKDKNGNLNEGLEELENKQGSFVEDDDSHSLNLIA